VLNSDVCCYSTDTTTTTTTTTTTVCLSMCIRYPSKEVVGNVLLLMYVHV